LLSEAYRAWIAIRRQLDGSRAAFDELAEIVDAVGLCEAVIAEGKWVSYLRVSTGRQGRSGLGLEAQRKAVDGGSWRLIKEFVEVESGKKSDRPVLAEATKACRVHGAKLVIAKIDHLSRDAHFLLGREKAGVDFVAADMPNANRLTVGIMAMIAEAERRMISARTKASPLPDRLCDNRQASRRVASQRPTPRQHAHNLRRRPRPGPARSGDATLI
jgi:Resolvase, N terminal domain